MNKWKEIKDMWDDTAYKCPYCNYTLYLTFGTPEENQSYYCPRCGKRLILEEQCS